MAVKFLNDIDLNLNEIQNFAVDNVGSRPSGVDGQLIFREDTNVLEFYNGTSWITLGDAAAAGTVTSVSATHAGDAFTASIGGNANEDPSVNITMTGTAAHYINGLGNKVAISSLPQGDVTSIVAGKGLTGSNLSGPSPTLDVDYSGSDNVILDARSANGDISTVAGGSDYLIINDATDSKVKTITVNQIVALAPQGDITAVTAGTGMTGGATSGNATLNVIGGKGIIANADNVQVDYTATGIIHDANTGTSEVLTDTDEFLFEDASASAGTAVKRGTLGQIKTYIGDTGVTSVNFKTDGNSLNVASNTVTGSGTMTGVWQGNSGQYVKGDGDLATFPSIPSVGNGQIDGRTSGLGLSGSMDATANQSGNSTFTVTSNATTSPTASTLMYRDSSGYGYSVTPSSGDNSTKIATTAFVKAQSVGGIKVKGGFNASTGILDDGSGDDLYTDVAIEIGDLYVVSTAGNFFGNSSTPLTPGDSVVAQKQASAGTAEEADFVVIQSDTDLATNTTVGLMTINASGNGITSNIVAGKATLTNTDKGSSQSIFKTVAVPSGSNAVADSNSDTLTFTASGGVTITGSSNDTINFSSANDNYYVTGGTFDTSDGDLTITGNNGAVGATINLDGRYLTGNQTITLSGDVSGSGTTSITTTIGSDAVEAGMLNNNVISGQTALTGTPAATDEILLSDNGVLKRIDYSDFIGGANSGVTSVIADTANNRKGIAVANGTSATPKVGLNITGLAGAVPVGNDTIPFYDSGTNKKTTVTNLGNAITSIVTANTSYTGTGPSASASTYPITAATHGLGSNSAVIMVQLVEVSSGETVYAEVVRGSAGLVTINFGANQAADSIRVLMQKIG